MASNRKIHGSSYGDGSKKPAAAASASSSSSRKRKDHVEMVSSEKRTKSQKSSRSSPYYVCDGVFRVSNTSDVNNLYDTQDQIDIVFLNTKGQREIDIGRAVSNLEEKGLRYILIERRLVIVTSLDEASNIKRKEYACIPRNTENWKGITELCRRNGRKYTSIDEILAKKTA